MVERRAYTSMVLGSSPSARTRLSPNGLNRVRATQDSNGRRVGGTVVPPWRNYTKPSGFVNATRAERSEVEGE